MKLIVTARSTSNGPRLQELITSKLGLVDKLVSIDTAHVTLSHEGDLHRCVIRIGTRHGEFDAEAEAGDAFGAVTSASDKLETVTRKEHDRALDRRRRNTEPSFQ